MSSQKRVVNELEKTRRDVIGIKEHLRNHDDNLIELNMKVADVRNN